MSYPKNTTYKDYDIREFDPATTPGNRFQGFKAGTDEPVTLYCKDANEVKALIDEYVRAMKENSVQYRVDN